MSEREFDAGLAEKCVTDQLATVYPNLSPVEGGHDFGRDADVADGIEPPVRVLVTTSPDVAANVRAGLKAMGENAIPFVRLIVATTAPATGIRRRNAERAASEFRAHVVAFYGQRWLGARLYLDHEWRERLLGIRGALEALVDRPIQLEQSPGAEAELVGRTETVNELRAMEGDVVVLGVPGVGKSRLLAELGDSSFVVGSATHDELAESIRETAPKRVVVDDAGAATETLEMLLEMRRQEEAQYQIVAVGWPSEEFELTRLLPRAGVLTLGILEPEAIDAIVTGLGVTSVVGRQVVLDQAAGRPGWAVSVASLILAGSSREVLLGLGLTRAVEPFLRRVTGQADDALGVLSHIAALGTAGPREVEMIGQRLVISGPTVQRVMRATTVGGLLERVSADTYSVEPAALRIGVVAYWFYEQAGALGLSGLIDAWPSFQHSLVDAALEAARMGSRAARHEVDVMLRAGQIAANQLATYADLDGAASLWAVAVLRKLELTGQIRHEILAAAAAELVPVAIDELLDDAIDDHRALHSHPDQPIRVLGEIARTVHPDFGHRFAARGQILEVAAAWAERRDDEVGWIVFARVAAEVLDPELTGNYLDPVRTDKVHIIGGVESAANMETILAEHVPQLEARLGHLPDAGVAALVPLAESWARTGRGQAPAWVGSLPEQVVAQATQVARRLVMSLAERSASSNALRTRLSMLVRQFDIELGIAGPALHEIVSAYPREQEEMRRLHDQLAEIGRQWADRDPPEVAEEMAAIGRELADVGLSAPGLAVVSRAIAGVVADPLPWLSVLIDESLCAEAAPFLQRAAVEEVSQLLGTLPRILESSCRGMVVGELLVSGDGRLATATISSLSSDDSRVVYYALTWADSVPAASAAALLEHELPDISAAAALGLYIAGARSAGLDGQTRDHWKAAFLRSAPIGDPPGVDYGSTHVLDGLVKEDPETLVDYLLARARAINEYDDLVPFHWRTKVATLPRRSRDRLVRGLTGRHQRIVLSHSIPSDPEWARSLVEDGALTANDLLAALGTEVGDFEDRAKVFESIGPVLVALGVDPTAVAASTEYVGGWGSDADRARRRLEFFRGLESSDDPNKQKLGSAGVALFEARLHLADAAQEHRRRARRRD